MDELIWTLKGLNVLVVEDEPLLSMAIADELERCQARVIGLANSVEEALGCLQSMQPDAVILDIELQGELVYDIADLLMRHGVPFLFSTALPENSIPDRFAPIPVCAKPAPAREILNALALLVSQVG